MSDNCFIAHEILNKVKSKRKSNRFEGILKIDLSKAYDRVRWDFIDKILQHMRFPPRFPPTWRQWIMECITTFTYAILINGEPTPFFTPKVDLRQGDPLSPYLFILVMEVLSKKLLALQSSNAIQGIKVARTAPAINHLFFADDTLF
uniref:Reverse transcriptase domain-containing protein n=1 Tax=Chenopodium quinoa TaxID=63459 RepID=A0A803MUL6_CHEQI